MVNQAQLAHVTSGKGFIAALDQSGGSTPKALRLYGVFEDDYKNDDEMYALIHKMRSRIVDAPVFTGEKVIGAILFEMTMDRQIGGKPAAQALWNDQGVVPFLKVDKGIMETHDGVQLMKPMDGLDTLLARAVKAGMFGTKMRSVINEASPSGIETIVAQQFKVAAQIIGHGLVPIIEPEVTITIANKAQAEQMLLEALLRHLDTLPADQNVMLKVSLPEVANLYAPCVNHPRVIRVVALSGGYDREEANDRLSKNNGVIASFSRALTQGVSAQQSDADFNATIAATVDGIYAASIT
jgi:fructose-bisphosphate aldolase class I